MTTPNFLYLPFGDAGQSEHFPFADRWKGDRWNEYIH